MKSIVLMKSKSRVVFNCEVQNIPMLIWVDTGAPNTLVPADFIERSGLPKIEGRTYKGKISGYEFFGKYALVLPEIVIPEYRSLRNVRAIAALDGKEFSRIILLGINVLNHGTSIIRRENDTGSFDFYESPASSVEGSVRNKFNHLLIDGKYLINDADTNELKVAITNGGLGL